MFASTVLIDGISRLLCVTPDYWTNYNNYGVEYNPIGVWGLEHGPFAFAAVVLLWALVFGFLIWKLPNKIGFIIALVLWLGHMMGSSGQIYWLLYSNLYTNWGFLIIYPLVIYIIVMTTLFALTALGFLGFKITPGKGIKRKKAS